MQGFINHHKDEGRRPDSIECFDHAFQAQQVAIFRHYQDYCERSGLVDFAELLLRALELLRDNDARRAHYQDRFSNILIDEFQDNQYPAICAGSIAGRQPQPAVRGPGDDDQSIYGWRGAKVENVAHFDRDFSPLVVRLEQKLSLHRHDSRSGQPGHRSQRRAHGQEPLDRGREGRSPEDFFRPTTPTKKPSS